MNVPKISGLLFSDFHFPEIFFFVLCPFQLRWVRVRSVMFSRVDYDYDTRFQCSWFNFNGPLQGFEQKRSPTRQRRGVPTNLWAWRTESELRKHEKFSHPLSLIFCLKIAEKFCQLVAKCF